MSTTIDQRVVEMRFDNKQFESATQTTMSTLDRLKQKLNLTGASKGLENINAESRRFNLNGLTSAVQTVHSKFSALEVMGVTALANITNQAVNAGKRMVSALTIDPIKSGFQEYETQINAVQTILANTSHAGTTLQDVNRVLDDLNLYADKTIYNFTQMTRNIGTFTAAGLGLEESASAIKGIANLAAVSGSTSQQASTAMYQLSQALANGKVNLQDWNSVVNAGMGGKVFQDALVRTAAAMKGVSEETFRAQNITGSFRESISSKDGGGWLSAEVLSKTLQQFTGDMSDAELAAMGFTETQIANIQKMAVTANEAATKVKTFTQLWDTLKEAAQSGWTQSWEIMVGDFEEAKEELTKISDTIGGMLGESADRRNTMLSEGLSSGWKQLLDQGIVDEIGYKESIEAIAKEHGVAFDDIIRKTEEAGGSFEDALIASLKDGKINSEMLTESVTHLADKMRNMSVEERQAAGYTDAHIESIEKLEKGLKDGSISMDEFVTKMTKLSGRQNIIQALWNSFEALLAILKPIKEAFREVFPPMTGEQLYNLTEKLRELTERFKISGTTANNIKRVFKGLFSALDIGVEAIKAIAGGALDLIKNFTGIGGSVLDVAASLADYITNFRDSIKETDVFGVAVQKVTGFITLAIDKIKEFGKSVKIGFETPGYEGFVGFLKFVWDLIKTVGSSIVNICSSIGSGLAEAFGGSDIFDVLNSGLYAGILAGILKFTNGLSKPLDSIKEMFDGIAGEDGVLDNVKGILDDVRGCFQAYQEQLKAGTLLKIASAIGILAASIFVISTIDGGALEKSLGAITVLFAELLGSLALFTRISTDITGTAKACIAMISISIAIGLLATALKRISSIDSMSIANALIAIGALMLELSIFLQTAKLDGKMTRTAIGIVVLSSAMLILAKAVKNFGSMKWGEIGKGLAAIGGLLVEMSLFTRLVGDGKRIISIGIAMIALGGAMKIFVSVMKDFSGMSWEEIGKGLAAMAGALLELTLALNFMPKNMVSLGVGLIAVSAAMKILADTLGQFGNMSWEEIARGLVAMGGALLELSIALNLMNGTLAGSAALIIAAGALAIIAPVMKTLGGMSWSEIAKSLVTLAGAFVVIGVAGALLTPIIPSILGLAAAFALFGVATLGIGAGLTLIGVGLTAIGTGFSILATGVSAGATAIVAGLTVIIMGIVGLIPVVAAELGKALVVFAGVIGESAPVLADALLKLITEVLNSFATYTPQIVDALMNFLIGVIDSLADKLPKLIASAMNFIGAFFQGIVDALSGIDSSNLFNGLMAIGLLSGLMMALSAVAGLIPGAMIGVLGMGVVIAELALVLAAIGAFAQIPGLSWLISEGGNFLEVIGTAIGKFIGGLAGGIASGFSSSLPDIGTDLSAFMLNVQPFIVGAKSIDESMMTGVKSLVEAILLITAADVINSIASWITGGSSMSDFAAQLVPFGEALSEFSATVSGNIDPGAVAAAAMAGQIMAEMASSLPNSGGVVGFFMGENDMSAFGNELVLFGDAISKFSATVSGNIDEGAVAAAANAGTMMAEMASTLPNSGGVLGFFAGDNDMSTFGQELVMFGQAISIFSATVTGRIDESAVAAAANAGTMMAEMASTLPNSGGVISWFAGDNDMSTFGRELVVFGNSIAQFSATVSGNVDEGAVTAAASAGSIMAEMASTLPNSGGVISWFTGDNDMSTFGRELVVFGRAIAEFSKTVSGNIDPASVMAAALSGKMIGDMAESLPDSGGVMSWFTADNDMSTFGQELVVFGRAVSAFSKEVSGNIDSEAAVAAATTGKIIAEMASSLPKSGGVISWFTADNDISTFASEIVPFGRAIRQFADEVGGGINEDAVRSATNAGKIIAEMAATLPESGGLSSVFGANNDLSTFASGIVPFGKAITDFSKTVAGNINEEAVLSASNAGKMLAEMANTLPESGGIASFFGADNDIATFAAQIVPFGKAICDFSKTVAGNVNEDAVVSAANAGKMLGEMAKSLPESGGIKSFFAADNDMSTFAAQMVPFGKAICDFSKTVAGNVNEDAVISAANAGKMLAEMAKTLPESGGVKSFFSADNDISTFAEQITPFGKAIADFSSVVAGKVNEDAVASATNAGTMLAKMAETLPESGGLSSFFGADNDMSTFAEELLPFGKAIAEFSAVVTGRVNEDAVIAAANSGKVLGKMAETLPESGGISSFFGADNDMSTFASQIVPFGKAIADFSSVVSGKINEEAVTAAANSGRILAEMAESLPDSGGIKSWFSADNDMSTFAAELLPFGRAIKSYSDAVVGIDADAVTASANAGKSLASLAQNLPTTGGLASWFTGDSDLSSFAYNLVPFGRAIKTYSDSVMGVDESAVSNSVSAGKKLVELVKSMTDMDSSNIANFNIVRIGSELRSYSDRVVDIDTSTITSSITNANKLIGLIKSTSGLDTSGVGSFVSAIESLASADTGGFAAAFKDSSKFVNAGSGMVDSIIKGITSKQSSMNSAGVTLVTKFTSGITSKKGYTVNIVVKFIADILSTINKRDKDFKKSGEKLIGQLAEGIKGQKTKVKNSCTSTISESISAIREYHERFYNAGSYLVSGFASGIKDNIESAANAAASMAAAAEKAAKEELDINSPSKVFRRIGFSVPEGFAQGIDRMANLVKTSAVDMAGTAVRSVSNSIKQIAEAVNTDIDAQPTIRPVVDLSDVRSGAAAISGLFNTPASVGVMANVGAISTGMNHRQNGGNDIVSAIDKLRKDVSNMGNTYYSIDGVNYTEGSDVAEALQVITRTAIRERRV